LVFFPKRFGVGDVVGAAVLNGSESRKIEIHLATDVHGPVEPEGRNRIVFDVGVIGGTDVLEVVNGHLLEEALSDILGRNRITTQAG
jgi:hypothetical protein